MKTNCFLYAWKQYRRQDARWIIFRSSEYSRFRGKIFWPLRILGWLLFYPATLLWLVSHYLILGTWPHFMSCKELKGECTEALPINPRFEHITPPIIFEAKITKTGEEDALL